MQHLHTNNIIASKATNKSLPLRSKPGIPIPVKQKGYIISEKLSNIPVLDFSDTHSSAEAQPQITIYKIDMPLSSYPPFVKNIYEARCEKKFQSFIDKW